MLLPSGFIDTDVLTADGRGDFTSTLLVDLDQMKVSKNVIEVAHGKFGLFLRKNNSFMWIYSNKHEGKIVGLSAGDPKKALNNEKYD